jgi:hypothetical protein
MVITPNPSKASGYLLKEILKVYHLVGKYWEGVIHTNSAKVLAL